MRTVSTRLWVFPLILMCFTAFPILMVYAEEPAKAPPPADSLPSWMQEKPSANPGSESGPSPARTRVLEPAEPIDPDSRGQIPGPTAPSDQRRVKFQFTPPKMPDVNKFRQKATRTVQQKLASGSELQIQESLQIGALQQESLHLQELASICANLHPGPERDRMVEVWKHQNRRWEAVQELSKLIGTSSAPLTGTGTTSVRQDPFRNQRIHELKLILGLESSVGISSLDSTLKVPVPPKIFPQPPAALHLPSEKTAPADAASSATASTTRKPAVASAPTQPPQAGKIPEHFYRPEPHPFVHQQEEDLSEESENASGSVE